MLDSSHGQIEHDVISKMNYVDAVIFETLRLYNSVLRMERQASEDYVLGDTGIVIENRERMTALYVFTFWSWTKKLYWNTFCFVRSQHSSLLKSSLKFSFLLNQKERKFHFDFYPSDDQSYFVKRLSLLLTNDLNNKKQTNNCKSLQSSNIY